MDLRALMEGHDLKDAFLKGHSMGGSSIRALHALFGKGEGRHLRHLRTAVRPRRDAAQRRGGCRDMPGMFTRNTAPAMVDAVIRPSTSRHLALSAGRA